MTDFPLPPRRVMAFALAAPLVIAACTSSDEPAGSAAAGADDAATAVATEATTGSSTEAGAEPGPDQAGGWLDIELTDAATGETYTLASLEGQVVAIEPMAIWCSNCKAQQDNVKTVYPQIADEVTYISLGIDPAETAETLASYAEGRGYEWTFSPSPVEFSRALSDLFGPQILSAPSTPLIVLDAEGEVVLQDFGFHGPEQLLGILDEAAARA